MENIKAVVPINYKEMTSLAKVIFRSRMFNSLASAEQTLLTMMAGREMGMGFIEACNSIYLVNGKVSLLYPKVGELIKASGKYDYKVTKHTNQECIIEFYKLSLNGKEWESIGVSHFSMLDAKKAGLKGMNCAKWFSPDVFGGSIYEPEELGAKVEYNEDGSANTVTIPTPVPIADTVNTKDGMIVGSVDLDIEEEDDKDTFGTDYLTVDGETALEVTVISTEEDKDRKGNPFQKYVFGEVITHIDKYGRRQTCDTEWNARRESYTNFKEIHDSVSAGDKLTVLLKINESKWNGKNITFQNIEDFILPETLDEVEEDEIEIGESDE